MLVRTKHHQWRLLWCHQQESSLYSHCTVLGLLHILMLGESQFAISLVATHCFAVHPLAKFWPRACKGLVPGDRSSMAFTSCGQ